MTATDSPDTETTIACACGCGQRFAPKRSGVTFIWGHKGAHKRAAARQPASSSFTSEAQRGYVAGIAGARKELAVLDRRIEHFDEEIEKLRTSLGEYHRLKNQAVDRHELVSATVEALTGLSAS